MAGETAAKEMVFGDVERELQVTRKVLERLPADQFEWKPHEKSMSLGSLGIHVASLPGWAQAALDADELDIAGAPRPPKDLVSPEALLALFDKNADALRASMDRFDMSRWAMTWTMRDGAKVFTAQPRPKVFRVWSINHLVHHRGQLSLYLRLLDRPVPTVYFNTADDPTWQFE